MATTNRDFLQKQQEQMRKLQEQKKKQQEEFERQMQKASQKRMEAARTTTKASTTPAATAPAATAPAVTTPSALDTLKATYAKTSNYTPMTDAEIEAMAKGEYSSKYNTLRTAAEQAQKRQDLALEQQLSTIGRSYDRQRDDTNEAYNKSFSTSSYDQLRKGMQRSSYGAQVLAGINSARDKALGDIGEQRATAEGNIASQRQQLADQLAETLAGYSAAEADDVLARVQQLKREEYDKAFEHEKYANELATNIYGYEYQQGRDAVSDSQFDKQYYASLVSQAAANGNDVSDEMLAKAGLSRADFNALKAQTTEDTPVRGGSYTPKTKPEPENNNNESATITQVISAISNAQRNSKSNSSQDSLKKNLVQQRKTMDRL